MITGITKIYGIIADPVVQVRTPEVFNNLCAHHGVDAVMVPMHVGGDGLEGMLAGLKRMKNLGGLIVTVPHKTEIARLCDELGDAGRLVGSINTLRRTEDGRFIGNMFDGLGFVAGLKSQNYELAGMKALLIGAGGAAAAIAFALADVGVTALTIANRTDEKAQDIVHRVKAAYPELDIQVGTFDPTGFDLIINATSLGMQPEDPLPLDPALLIPEMIVAEIIMKPETTALLSAAKKRGCAVHYGRHMLDQQIRLMAEFMGVKMD